MLAVNWLVLRAKEPSTHAAIAAVLTAVANFVPYPYSWIVLGVAGLFGGAGVVVKDKGMLPPAQP